MNDSPTTDHRLLWPTTVTAGYLNGASRAPQLTSVAQAARAAVDWREANAGMPIAEFFNHPELVKREFARLINCAQTDRIALIPSASYGLATVAANLPLRAGQNIVVAAEQFPSNYYVWQRLCQERNAELRVVAQPEAGSADTWSDRLLSAVDDQTAAVALSQLHWADGTLYNLPTLRARTRDVDAWLILDGTQSVGAYPLDVATLRPDALIAAGYKWLQGPYGCAYAYYGPRLDDGRPLEENWINRIGSDNFAGLVNYQNEYRPLASRYSVGEHSNFLMMPMQLAALRTVNEITPEIVQEHTAGLWAAVEDELADLGIQLPDRRAHHLVGLRLPQHWPSEALGEQLTRRGLTVSFRGDAVRVSPNVYNTADDLQALVAAFRAIATRRPTSSVHSA